MAGFFKFQNLAPRSKNAIVAAGLTGFVFSVYFYTMKAVGSTDEIQVAVHKVEAEKQREASKV